MNKMLLLAVALAPATLWAQSQQCSLETGTLNGTYVIRNSGTVMIASGSGGVPIAAVGIITFDTQGNFRATFTGSVNGNVLKGLSSVGTYTVNRDCTGSMTLGAGPSASHYDLVVSPDGKQAYSIQTDSGSVTTQVYTRQDH